MYVIYICIYIANIYYIINNILKTYLLLKINQLLNLALRIIIIEIY